MASAVGVTRALAALRPRNCPPVRVCATCARLRAYRGRIDIVLGPESPENSFFVTNVRAYYIFNFVVTRDESDRTGRPTHIHYDKKTSHVDGKSVFRLNFEVTVRNIAAYVYRNCSDFRELQELSKRPMFMFSKSYLQSQRKT